MTGRLDRSGRIWIHFFLTALFRGAGLGVLVLALLPRFGVPGLPDDRAAARGVRGGGRFGAGGAGGGAARLDRHRRPRAGRLPPRAARLARARDAADGASREPVRREYRGGLMTVDLLPKDQIEIVVRDSDVETLISTISEASRTGKIGDGKIFVIPIERAIRIRTWETEI